MKKSVMHALLCGAAAALCAAGQSSASRGGAAGAVFAATNDANHNEVVMYARSTTGALKYVGNFATGGRGQGGINDPLQSQNSLVLSSDPNYLLAVNAGSSTLSVFQVHYWGLRLLDTEPTRGGNPVSIAMHDDLVYVANVGGTYHTAGFHLRPWGELEFIPIPNNLLAFSTPNPAPSLSRRTGPN
jgi:hypothetical protein